MKDTKKSISLSDISPVCLIKTLIRNLWVVAACALIFHIKNRQIVWRAVWPAALAGSVCAVGGAMLAQNVDAELLRKLFGGFLVLVGLSEILLKGLKKE